MQNVNLKYLVQCRAAPHVVEVANQGFATRATTIFVGVQCVRNLSLDKGIPNERGARVEVFA